MTNRDKPSSGTPDQANEGEGNKTAARHFNKAEQDFVRSGKVDEKAREAEQAVDGAEGKALAEAEAIGRSHSAGEDPLLKKTGKR